MPAVAALEMRLEVIGVQRFSGRTCHEIGGRPSRALRLNSLPAPFVDAVEPAGRKMHVSVSGFALEGCPLLGRHHGAERI